MRRDATGPIMRTAAPPGDRRVDWLIGGKRMQDAVTVFPDGRWQVLPVYWHVRTRRWVDYTENKQGALTPDHPFYWTNFRRTANRECLDCHVTGLAVTYDRAAHRFATRFAEPGVACESCHGPGARHSESEEPADIVQPAKLPPAERLAVCGSCHGPREPLFPILDAARRYQPGERYEDHYLALVVVDGRERSGDFFADGRPSSSSYELQALLQSACHRKGGADCLTCHAPPHAAAPRRDELRVAADDSCRACHPAIAADERGHSHHPKAVGCVACHMAPVVSGVLDHFADHTIDVPVPENTVRHGVPNACNGCHAHEKEAPASTAAALLRLWPGAAARQARRLRLADAIDEAHAAASADALAAVIADEAEAPTLRGAAMVLYGQRFPAAATARLAPFVRHRDPVLRIRAAEALGDACSARRGGGEEAPCADALAAAAEDPSLSVRHAVAIALATARDRRAERAVARLVADPASAALPQPQLLAGLMAIGRGDLDLAEDALARAVSLAPYHVPALIALAWVEQQRGELDRARDDLEEALRFDPANALVKQRLAALAR